MPGMNQRRGWPAAWLAAGVIVWATAGCEDDSLPVRQPVEESSPADAPPPAAVRPSTQSILEAPRKRIPLKLLPFTIEAPESWAVQNHDTRTESVTMLEGPMINDEAHVTLGLRETMSGEILRNYINRLKKENETLAKTGGSVTIREFGGIQLIDIRRPPASPSGNDAEDSMEWRITLLYPSGIGHDQYELRFIGLTVESYKANQEWLTKMLDTLQYDDAGVAPR